jgi:fatty-acyl-CoA synthase
MASSGDPLRDSPRHFAHWPPGVPHHLPPLTRTLPEQLAASAARFGDKPAVVFHDTPHGYRTLQAQVEHLAGHLQHRAGLQPGDRVLLVMQNSPQWMVGCYGTLRAQGVVVPVNPMNRLDELRHLARDSGARVALVAQDLLPEVLPLLDDGSLQQVVVATYSDALDTGTPTDMALPPVVSAPRQPLPHARCIAWADALADAPAPRAYTGRMDDLAVMPYTSGTTGRPKGCMHTHRTVSATVTGGVLWFGRTHEDVYLSVLPLFHVTGFIGGLCGPLSLGATIVMLARWDREAAALSIARHRVSTWQAISTMLIDFLAQPQLRREDLASLKSVRGGGAAMPEAVAARLHALTGLEYVEGYGMSEMMAATHINPPQRPKRQCLGLPVMDVDARLLDPLTLQPVADGEVGEIVMHAPQQMLGYWNDPEGTAAVFVDIGGRRFLRSGDLARVDEDGYFFMVDRLKRMINASGYKVWPAEVEALLHGHPAIQEACVIAARDPKRGETVKALVVLHAGAEATTEQQVIDWAHERMAAYKAPRIVQFVPSLPKGGAGKVLWRELQRQEDDNNTQGDRP